VSSITIDESKIDDLVSTYGDTEAQLMAVGSDEHLDMLIDIQRNVQKLTALTIAVNDEIESHFNLIDEANARNLVIKLTAGLRLARQVITILSNSPAFISEGLSSCKKDLYLETKQLDEFVSDLIRFKINSPGPLNDLLNAIK